MCGTRLKSSAQRAFSLKWELVNCHRTGVSIRGSFSAATWGRGFTYNLVSSRLQYCQLECARHFSRGPDLQLFVLLPHSGTDTRLCRWPCTNQRSPLVGPVSTTEPFVQCG